MFTNALVMASLLPLSPVNWNSDVTVDFLVVDNAGTAISNAVIMTRTQRDRLGNLGHAGPAQRKIGATTDANGRASIKFPCYSGEFSSSVSAEGFYLEEKKYQRFKYASDSVYFAHLLEHEKSLTFVLYHQKNPIALYSNFGYDDIRLPILGERIGYDIKVGDWVPPYGRGITTDFFVKYTESCTNGVLTGRSEILFDGLNGAYRMKCLPSTTIWSDYSADAAAEYLTHFEMEVRFRNDGRFLDREHDILAGDEYLVLRTRAVANAAGGVKSANYSKIRGPMKIFKYFHFEQSCFNPTPNDTNLEFDERRNLAPRRRKR